MHETDQALTPLEASILARKCVATIKRHDSLLRPVRTPNGRRFYLRSRVEAWIAGTLI